MKRSDFAMQCVLLSALLAELLWFSGKENIKMLITGLKVAAHRKKVIVDNKTLKDCTKQQIGLLKTRILEGIASLLLQYT